MSQDDFIKYIYKRIIREDYRGIHLSQHNRLPFDKVANILHTIFDLTKGKKLYIHIGDWHSRKQANCVEYYKIVEVLRKNIGQCTVNSLKKNIFPDLDRMGFLNRYDKNGVRIKYGGPGVAVKSVSMSDLAIKFVKSKTTRKRYKIYIQTTEKLLEPILDDLFNMLYFSLESINIFEYMFIISDPQLNKNEKVALIKSYRRLKKIDRIKLVQDIQIQFSEINRKARVKSQKRDFGNWYNESLQIFSLLNQTIYFKTFGRTTLMLGLSQEGLELNIKRSEIEKNKYFEWHNVHKKSGYQLHHIYPLSFATTRKDLELIDNHKNLIYLSDKIHSKIPHANNLFVEISKKDKKILLINPAGDQFIDITKDASFKESNVDAMVDYNKKLLSL